MFGDGLGRAADSSFVTPQPFDVLFCLVLVFNSQITMETSNNLTFLQRVRSGRCNTPCSGQQRHQVPRPT